MEDARDRIVSRRRGLAALAALPLIVTGVARAATAAGPKRLAILSIRRREEGLENFRSNFAKPFAERGWVEGRTIEFVRRFCEYDMSRIPALAKELVDARPNVIGTMGTAATRALQQATRTIPIFTSVGDPVGSGFARSLARPGGNITGLSQGTREIAQKQVELLRAAVPMLSTLAIVGADPSPAFLREMGEPVALAARGVGVSTELRQVSSLQGVESVLRALPSAGKGAVLFMRDLGDMDEGSVMGLAIRLRVPALVGDPDRVEKGGLLSYTLYRDDEVQRSLAILDKLLRGADPAVIPFELPAKSHFAVNRATAAAIGVKLPPEFLLRADKVFE